MFDLSGIPEAVVPMSQAPQYLPLCAKIVTPFQLIGLSILYNTRNLANTGDILNESLSVF